MTATRWHRDARQINTDEGNCAAQPTQVHLSSRVQTSPSAPLPLPSLYRAGLPVGMGARANGASYLPSVCRHWGQQTACLPLPPATNGREFAKHRRVVLRNARRGGSAYIFTRETTCLNDDKQRARGLLARQHADLLTNARDGTGTYGIISGYAAQATRSIAACVNAWRAWAAGSRYRRRTRAFSQTGVRAGGAGEVAAHPPQA